MNAKQRRQAKRHPEVRKNPKHVGHPPKIGVEKGFGPRHAANSKEGEDLTKVDTDVVPAMLTPREAVLNRNAAEMAGRGNIEALNEKGNLLAKRGVDLAAGGDSDVRMMRRDEEVPALERNNQLIEEESGMLGSPMDRSGASPLLAELMGAVEGDRRTEMKDLIRRHLVGGHQTFTHKQFDYDDPLVREVLKELGVGVNPAPKEEMYPEGVQRGTSNMQLKPKHLAGGDDQVARNPFPNRGPGGVYPSVPGLGGGAPPDQIGGFGGGLGARDEFGRQFSQRNAAGAFGAGHGVPDPNAAPPGYDRPPTPNPWGTGPFNEPPRRGAPIGVQPMPAIPPQQWRTMPSQPFYPPGQGLRMAQGEEDILGNPGSIYGGAAPVSLSSPGGLGDLVKAITSEAQKQGLNANQIAGILKMVQGMGGAGGGSGLTVGAGTGNMDAVGAFQGGTSSAERNPYGDSDIMPAIDIEDLATVPTSMGESERRRLLEELRISIPSANDQTMREIERYMSRVNAMKDMPHAQYQPPRTPAPRYSGGISEVGYAPGISPNANFSYDRGGWVGAYDPRYSFPSY